MRQRKQVVIEPAVQWAIARRLIVHWLLFCAAILVVYSALDVMLTIGELPPRDAAIRSVTKQLPMVVTMILMLPLFLRDSLLLSRRFAGPVYRLRKALRELAAGEGGRPLKFRDGDFWSEISDDFNQVRQRILNAEAAATEPDHEFAGTR